MLILLNIFVILKVGQVNTILDMNPIKVLAVDDHDLITLAIKQILAKHHNIQLIDSVKFANDAFYKIQLLRPDVVILDICLPDASGFDIMEKVLLNNPNIRFIIYTGSEKEEDIIQSFEKGAYGYVLKSAKAHDLVEAIESVARGEHYSKGLVSDLLISSFLKRKTEKEVILNITNREREILQLIICGKTNQEIADQLFISKRTVEAHKSNIMHKLHMKTTVELVMYGLKMKLIKL